MVAGDRVPGMPEQGQVESAGIGQPVGEFAGPFAKAPRHRRIAALAIARHDVLVEVVGTVGNPCLPLQARAGCCQTARAEGGGATGFLRTLPDGDPEGVPNGRVGSSQAAGAGPHNAHVDLFVPPQSRRCYRHDGDT